MNLSSTGMIVSLEPAMFSVLNIISFVAEFSIVDSQLDTKTNWCNNAACLNVLERKKSAITPQLDTSVVQ